MRYTLTILEDHFLKVDEDSVQNNTGYTFLLCGTSIVSADIWDKESEIRFLSKYVIQKSEQQTDNVAGLDKPSSNDRILEYVIERAKQEKLNICFVRNSISQELGSSDDALTLLFKKEVADFVSTGLTVLVLYIHDKDLSAFIRTKDNDLSEISFIRVIGKRFRFYYPQKFTIHTPTEFNRQQLAFGDTLTVDLSKLRIGVIGCGATGSATSHMLARLGIGQLLLIDKDVVERTNLNRLYGATMDDADKQILKVSVLKNLITGIGVGCNVKVIPDWVGAQTCQESLKSCDIIFCCTDDNSGRVLLNRLAYFYHIPVIDMGLEISMTKVEPKKITAIMARVTVILPGTQCLICRKVVNTRLAREESLERTDPEAYRQQKVEAYVTGEGNPRPAVITFTTETATMAVNELLHRMTGFKNGVNTDHFVHFIDVQFSENKCIRKPSSEINKDCPICSNKHYWGTGDVIPFLDTAN